MNIYRFEELLKTLVAQAIKDNNEGEQNFTVRLPGNWEPEDNKIKKVVQKVMSSGELMLNDLSIIYTGEHTVVYISVFDKRHVLMYIKVMKDSLNAVQTNDFAIKMLGKAIIMLDEYNVRFKSIHNWDRTSEINELDEALKTLKDF